MSIRDMAECIPTLLFIPVGVWCVTRPIRAVRYFLRERSLDITGDPSTRLIMRIIGVVFIFLGSSCLIGFLLRRLT